MYERSYIWTVEKDIKTWLIIAVMHNLSRCEIKAWKRLRPERDSSPWPLQYQSVLYQLSYQTNWGLVTLWVCNVHVDNKEECKWTHEISYISQLLKLSITLMINHVFMLNISRKLHISSTSSNRAQLWVTEHTDKQISHDRCKHLNFKT